MEPWLQVVLVVLTGVLALAGVLLGGHIQRGAAKDERQAAYLQEHNREAFVALAELRQLANRLRTSGYDESNPGQSRVKAGEVANEVLALAGELTRVVVSHPSKEVRESAQQVMNSTGEAAVTLMRYLRALGNGEKDRETEQEIDTKRQVAENSWNKLDDRLAGLIELMHSLQS